MVVIIFNVYIVDGQIVISFSKPVKAIVPDECHSYIDTTVKLGTSPSCRWSVDRLKLIVELGDGNMINPGELVFFLLRYVRSTASKMNVSLTLYWYKQR